MYFLRFVNTKDTLYYQEKEKANWGSSKGNIYFVFRANNACPITRHLYMFVVSLVFLCEPHATQFLLEEHHGFCRRQLAI